MRLMRPRLSRRMGVPKAPRFHFKTEPGLMLNCINHNCAAARNPSQAYVPHGQGR
ncbi:protein of unknown function [Azospirillum lipoferum 4B]|uniref:Uncharacterized protein n=1 Tax=Azospirillum lipoferum (strain 4B) TaxID=862719 RepID=G7Z7C6_AZOL4|nr:protein of unknown function [Azospirillum lipoferum 4B]